MDRRKIQEQSQALIIYWWFHKLGLQQSGLYSCRCFTKNIFINEFSTKRSISVVNKYPSLGEVFSLSWSSASNRKVNLCTQSHQWTPDADRTHNTTVNLYGNCPDSWATNINMVSDQPELSGNCYLPDGDGSVLPHAPTWPWKWRITYRT